MAIVVPLYWVTYSPWNFLYFCDVALLVTAMAIWIESPLLVSTQAVAIVACRHCGSSEERKGRRGKERKGREKGTRTFFHVCVFVNSTFLGRPRG